MTKKYWDGENWLKLKKIDNRIVYSFNEKPHRKNGPAVIKFYDNGYKMFEQYFQYGKLHRIDGPAKIVYYYNGNLFLEKYYYNGIEFDTTFLPFELPIDKSEKEFYIQLKYSMTYTFQ